MCGLGRRAGWQRRLAGYHEGEAGEKADSENTVLPRQCCLRMLFNSRAMTRRSASSSRAWNERKQGVMVRVPGPGSTVTRVNAFSTDIFTENAGACRTMPGWSQARLQRLVRL